MNKSAKQLFKNCEIQYKKIIKGLKYLFDLI